MTHIEEVYNGLKDANKITEANNLSKSMRMEKAIEDGWAYTFFFDHNHLAKVEAYNGRELIEAYNK